MPAVCLGHDRPMDSEDLRRRPVVLRTGGDDAEPTRRPVRYLVRPGDARPFTGATVGPAPGDDHPAKLKGHAEQHTKHNTRHHSKHH